MSPLPLLDELYRYNRWANSKVLALAADLTDEQLDQPRELGMGSLRKTLFHILVAEEIWLERWQRVPPRTFPTDPAGIPLAEISTRLNAVAEQRGAFLHTQQGKLAQPIDYVDSRGNPYTNPLDELLLHVANHGIHHRAQALAYLKSFGRTTPGGIDHIFFRLAQAAHQQTDDAAAWIRQAGLQVATATSPHLDWDGDLIARWFSYSDWATRRLMRPAATLDESTDNGAAIDRDFGMGMGSIRKTLLHIYDAERSWLSNYHTGSGQFVKLPATTSLATLAELWKLLVVERNQFLNTLDSTSAAQIIGMSFGGPMMQFPLVETLVQLCGHGTHHRAQLSNMLRHSALEVPGVDYVLWVRER